MKLLIADDHDLLRDALAAYLQARGDIEVAEARDVSSALTAVGEQGPFDLVLLDFQMPGMDGLSGLRKVIAADPTCPVILLSGVATAGTVSAALKAGAAGVLSKTMPLDALTTTLRETVASRGTAASLGVAAVPSPVQLTPRQEQVLRTLCRGCSNKEIARELQLQEATVKMYVKMLYAKLGVNNRTQAALAAREHGFS